MKSNHISHRVVKLESVEPVVVNPWDEAERHKGMSVARLRGVFHAVANPGDWKAPWVASVPEPLVDAVKAAVEFFHADVATVHGQAIASGNVLMSGRGYQA